VTTPTHDSQAEHNRQTQDAYDRLAAVWSATTDDGAFNGLLERQPSPEARERYPAELAGMVGIPTFIVYRLAMASKPTVE
jgi:hypothetical protein